MARNIWEGLGAGIIGAGNAIGNAIASMPTEEEKKRKALELLALQQNIDVGEMGMEDKKAGLEMRKADLSELGRIGSLVNYSKRGLSGQPTIEMGADKGMFDAIAGMKTTSPEAGSMSLPSESPLAKQSPLQIARSSQSLLSSTQPEVKAYLDNLGKEETEIAARETTAKKQAETQQEQQKRMGLKTILTNPNASDEQKRTALTGYFAETSPEKLTTLLKDDNDLMEVLKITLMGKQLEKTNKDLEKADRVPLSEQQKRDVTAVGTGTRLLTSLVNEFKSVNTGNAIQAAKSKISDLPIVGQRIAPKEASYNSTKRLTAETYLREATGATAPEKEVDTYEGFMPDIGDTPEQAQSKLNVFIDRIKAKNEGVVSYLEAFGDMESAKKIREQGQRLLSTIPKIIEANQESSFTTEKQNRLEELRKKKAAGTLGK